MTPLLSITIDPFHFSIALELVDRISGAMDSGPLAIFLDLSKAFDTLYHNILLHKLSFLGIKDMYLNLLRNYLSDRKQYVEINQIKSNQIYFQSPQVYLKDLF